MEKWGWCGGGAVQRLLCETWVQLKDHEHASEVTEFLRDLLYTSCVFEDVPNKTKS